MLSQITPDDFTTDFNRRVYAAFLEKIANDPMIGNIVSSISESFTADEVGRITSFEAMSSNVVADAALVESHASRHRTEK